MNNSEIINNFIKYLEETKKSPSTIIAYKKDLEQLSGFLENKSTSLLSASTNQLTDFTNYLLNEKKFSPKTVSRKINSINTLYGFLLENKLININPSVDLKHPDIKPKKQRILSIIEYKALRDTVRHDERLFAMTELMLQTGIKIGELSRLKISDLKLDSNNPYMEIKEFSSYPARTVELNESAQSILSRWLKKRDKIKNDNGYLFSTKTGNKVMVRNIRSSISKAFKEVGIEDATVNDIRNTFIHFQLVNDVSLEKVANTVGHQRLSSTERYIKEIKPTPKANLNKLVSL